MKISRNWLNNYIKSKKSDIELVDTFTQLGLECTSTKINSIDSDIIVGEVVSCVNHPNADRLKVCKVDVSGDELLTIVCGASNIKDKIFVPVAKIGSKIGKFKIKKTKIRDVVSHGMICSEKELGLSDNHEGIMILDKTFKKGHQLKEFLPIEEDSIFDFDITPNRGDCLSHIGIARELSIIEKSKSKVKNYEYKAPKLEERDEILTVTIENKKCLRYAACIIRNVIIKDSPDWLKENLESIGQKSINNVVDAANFVLMDLGHPMHTFDLDKIKSNKINVRVAKKNETIITLDNCKQKLNSDNLLICDGNSPIAIAGVIGGINSGVDKKTKNILIESAYFEPLNIRKTSKSLGLSTEASRRFERDTDINMLIPALNKLASLIQNIAGGEISSNFFDIYDKEFDNFDSNGLLLPHILREISFDINKCNHFLGTNISLKEVNKIFNSLYIDSKNKDGKLICVIPSFRNDLNREIDLYEEVARVFGYDNIPISKTFNNSYSAIIDDAKDINNQIRLILCSKGFYEHYSNSLYNDKVLKDFNTFETPEIINESSQDMKYMRNSLMPGLLKAVSFNEKRDQNYFKLFEIGRVHSLIKSYNKEEDNMGFVWYGENNQHWNSKFTADIFYAKGELLSVLNQLKISDIHFKSEESEFSEVNINIYSKKSCIGYLRLLDLQLKEKYDIKGAVVVSEMYLDKINKNVIKDFRYQKISQFPSIKRDISILLKKEIKSVDIINCIYNSSDNLLIDAIVFDVYSGKELDKDSKSLSISLTFQSNEKTLIDKDVDDRVLSVLDKLKTTFSIVQR